MSFSSKTLYFYDDEIHASSINTHTTYNNLPSEKLLIGNKSYNLRIMHKIGLPVPYFFSITTDVYRYFSIHRVLPDSFLDELFASIIHLEKLTQKKFLIVDDTSGMTRKDYMDYMFRYAPTSDYMNYTSNTQDFKNLNVDFESDYATKKLFLSVRSSSAISMPGMMDTILNVGTTLQDIEIFKLNTKRYSNQDSKIQNFLEGNYYNLIEKLRLSNDQISIIKYNDRTIDNFNEKLQYDSFLQLLRAIELVLSSYTGQNAFFYRKQNKIPDIGIAITVQVMVFGNHPNTNSRLVDDNANVSDPNDSVQKDNDLNRYQGNNIQKSISLNNKHQGNSIQEGIDPNNNSIYFLSTTNDSNVIDRTIQSQNNSNLNNGDDSSVYRKTSSSTTIDIQDNIGIEKYKCDNLKNAHTIPQKDLNKSFSNGPTLVQSINKSTAGSTTPPPIVINHKNYDKEANYNISCTGVMFTRDPSNGHNRIVVEFLLNAQGELLVSGTLTPTKIVIETERYETYSKNLTLADVHKYSVKQDDIDLKLQKVSSKFASILVYVAQTLEKYYKDMQDIEFTIENGRIYILQTRNGKRTVSANIKIIYDLYKLGILSSHQAVNSIDADKLDQILHDTIQYDDATHNTQNTSHTILGVGLPCAPGAVTGQIALSSSAAVAMSKKSSVILLREITSPDDIDGIHASRGLLTIVGGTTSHAAVVARGMGLTCICGANFIKIDKDKIIFKVSLQNSIHSNILQNHKNFDTFKSELTLYEGDEITIDGHNGRVIYGSVVIFKSKPTCEFISLLQVADDIICNKHRDTVTSDVMNNNSKNNISEVRVNADSYRDIEKSIELGAKGVGLCRTEHMMFEPDKIDLFRSYILTDNIHNKRRILEILESKYIQNFKGFFEVLKGLPISIRLLDPPLHEFLPNFDIISRATIDYIIDQSEISIEQFKNKLLNLRESNPMLGHRGCRLGITNRDLYEMQVKSIFKAALLVNKNTQVNVEIIIPFINDVCEFLDISKMIKLNYSQIIKDSSISDNNTQCYPNNINYKIGTMIEIPRAVYIAGELAKYCDYFSFGTNDLTQTTFGISRDDMASFLPKYEKQFEYQNPFVRVDEVGVGSLMVHAIKAARKINPNIKFSVCGEHAGDAKSIKYFNKIGIHSISCSLYRIWNAKIAASQII